MKAPLALPKSAASAPALRLRAPVLAVLRELPAARVLPWLALAGILGCALFLRLYRLEGLVTYYPDSYAQLRGVDNLLSARFPISYLYPPGVALALAPAFALLPDTLVTMQATILLAGAALVLLAYAATSATTGDQRAALLFALAVALGAPFVYYSRVTLFDGINTLFVALCLFLAPHASRRGSGTLLAYSVLVFTTITIRFTNLALLPVLFVASLPQERPICPRVVVNHLRSRAVATVALAVVALYAAYVATAYETFTRFANPKAGSIIDFSTYFERLGRYAEATLIGYGDTFHWENGLAAAAVLVFALIGARKLWNTNRGLLLPLGLLAVVWAPVHAVYEVFAGRYVLPAFFCVLLLACVGLSSALSWQRRLARPWQRVGAAALLTLGVMLFLGRQLAFDTTFLQQWPANVAQGRETAYDPVRERLRDLDGDVVLVSSQALAVDRANPAVTTYDLIPFSEMHGINADSVERLLAYVRERQAEGKTVYYHYTEYEDVQSRFRKYELSFDAYFDAVRREFGVREVVRAHVPKLTQRLYLIEAPPE